MATPRTDRSALTPHTPDASQGFTSPGAVELNNPHDGAACDLSGPSPRPAFEGERPLVPVLKAAHRPAQLRPEASAVAANPGNVPDMSPRTTSELGFHRPAGSTSKQLANRQPSPDGADAAGGSYVSTDVANRVSDELGGTYTPQHTRADFRTETVNGKPRTYALLTFVSGPAGMGGRRFKVYLDNLSQFPGQTFVSEPKDEFHAFAEAHILSTLKTAEALSGGEPPYTQASRPGTKLILSDKAFTVASNTDGQPNQSYDLETVAETSLTRRNSISQGWFDSTPAARQAEPKATAFTGKPTTGIDTDGGRALYAGTRMLVQFQNGFRVVAEELPPGEDDLRVIGEELEPFVPVPDGLHIGGAAEELGSRVRRPRPPVVSEPHDDMTLGWEGRHEVDVDGESDGDDEELALVQRRRADRRGQKRRRVAAPGRDETEGFMPADEALADNDAQPNAAQHGGPGFSVVESSDDGDEAEVELARLASGQLNSADRKILKRLRKQRQAMDKARQNLSGSVRAAEDAGQQLANAQAAVENARAEYLQRALAVEQFNQEREALRAEQLQPAQRALEGVQANRPDKSASVAQHEDYLAAVIAPTRNLITARDKHAQSNARGLRLHNALGTAAKQLENAQRAQTAARKARDKANTQVQKHEERLAELTQRAARNPSDDVADRDSAPAQQPVSARRPRGPSLRARAQRIAAARRRGRRPLGSGLSPQAAARRRAAMEDRASANGRSMREQQLDAGFEHNIEHAQDEDSASGDPSRAQANRRRASTAGFSLRPNRGRPAEDRMRRQSLGDLRSAVGSALHQDGLDPRGPALVHDGEPAEDDAEG